MNPGGLHACSASFPIILNSVAWICTIAFRFCCHMVRCGDRRLRVAHTCAQGKPSFRAGGLRDNADEQYAANHGQFMSMVHSLIEGNLESSSYEDQCRALLGAQNTML